MVRDQLEIHMRPVVSNLTTEGARSNMCSLDYNKCTDQPNTINLDPSSKAFDFPANGLVFINYKDFSKVNIYK